MSKLKIRIDSDQKFDILSGQDNVTLSRGCYTFFGDAVTISQGTSGGSLVIDATSIPDIVLKDNCKYHIPDSDEFKTVAGFSAKTETINGNPVDPPPSSHPFWSSVGAIALFVIGILFVILIAILVFAMKVKIAKKIIK